MVRVEDSDDAAEKIILLFRGPVLGGYNYWEHRVVQSSGTAYKRPVGCRLLKPGPDSSSIYRPHLPPPFRLAFHAPRLAGHPHRRCYLQPHPPHPSECQYLQHPCCCTPNITTVSTTTTRTVVLNVCALLPLNPAARATPPPSQTSQNSII